MTMMSVKKMKTWAGVVIATGFVLCAFVAEGVAQEGVITLEDTVIKGRIQKPEAFYILQHSNLDYEDLDANASFIDELVESVNEPEFE